MMKRILFLALFGFLNVFISAQNWEWQNSNPTPYNLHQGVFLSQKHGILVGDYGTILTTTDCCLTWNEMEAGSKKDLTAVDFYNDQIGFIGGKEIILKTSDGGLNWEIINNTIPCYINGFLFPNDSTIIAYGEYQNNGQMLRSTDFGHNWDLVFNYQERIRFQSISEIKVLSNGNYLGIATCNKIIKSMDNGITWEIVNDSSVNCVQNSISLLNDSTAIIVGQGSGISLTTNYGLTTQLVYPIHHYTELISVVVLNDSSAFAVSDNGNFYFSDKYYLEWTRNESLDQSSLNDIVKISSNEYLIIGDKGTILKTDHQGENQVLLSNEVSGSITDIHFVNESIGWASTWNSLLFTNNGGKKWEKIANQGLKGIYFVNDQVGFGISELFGSIIKTVDGGKNWVNAFGDDLLSIFFINDSVGWAVGGQEFLLDHANFIWKGYIYATRDAGKTWKQQGETYSNILRDIFFYDDKIGYASGDDIILFTQDGGDNWNLSSETVPSFRNFYFISSKIGLGVGNLGTSIGRTIDGGNSWEYIDFSSQYYCTLSDIMFFDSYIGFAVGEKGTICLTNDAGNSWQILEKFTDLGFHSLFLSEESGWIGGSNGLIVKFKRSEITSVEEDNIIFNNKIYLSDNYPNPFNPTTKINYSIPYVEIRHGVSLQTELIVYNLLGQKIAVLVDEYKSPGNYEVEFNGSNLTSGVYLYTLRFGNQRYTKKMLLVK